MSQQKRSHFHSFLCSFFILLAAGWSLFSFLQFEYYNSDFQSNRKSYSPLKHSRPMKGIKSSSTEPWRSPGLLFENLGSVPLYIVEDGEGQALSTWICICICVGGKAPGVSQRGEHSTAMFMEELHMITVCLLLEPILTPALIPTPTQQGGNWKAMQLRHVPWARLRLLTVVFWTQKRKRHHYFFFLT